MRFFEVAVVLATREFEHRRSKLTSWERRKINSRTRMYFFMKGSRVVLRDVRLREEPLTHYVFWNSLGNEIWSIYNAKYSEMWTFYTPCVFVAVSGDFCHEMYKVLKHKCFALEPFFMKATPARRVTPPWDVYMAKARSWSGSIQTY